MINEHFERIVKEKFGFDFSPTQQAAMKNFLHFSLIVILKVYFY